MTATVSGRGDDRILALSERQLTEIDRTIDDRADLFDSIAPRRAWERSSAMRVRWLWRQRRIEIDRRERSFEARNRRR